MPVQSREYTEFLEEEKLGRKLTWYERFCSITERVLPIEPWKQLADDYNKSAEFAHLKITAKGAFSITILAMALVFLVPLILLLVFNLFSTSVLLLPLIFSVLAFFYFYTYPTRYATTFRIKASAEILMATIYITIAMRISPNIEGAVKFAATNLSGPLAFDLRKLLWDVYARRYESMSAALDSFVGKWKKDNEEFTQALILIKGAVFESRAKLEATLDEAVKILLDGTKERMKHYAQYMRTPVTVLNAMGILLPIIGLVFFPIISLFLPDAIQPSMLVIGYNILLPLGVYWLLEIYLEKRPYTFHQPDITKHPKFSQQKMFGFNSLFALIVSISLISFGSFHLLTTQERFSEELLYYSIFVTWGIAAGIILYSILSVYNKLKLRNEITQIESEFAEAMFHLGNQLTRGIPLENAIKNTVPKIRDLKISKFLEIVLYNIETLGMTFEQSLFDVKNGAIHAYPSRTIEVVMKAIVEISRKGMQFVATSLISVSTYLKNMHAVEEDLKEMLSETTSTMSVQAILLAPLTAGIVVGLTAMITQILLALKGSLERIFGGLETFGPLGSAGTGLISSIINVEAIIPVHHFQIIVGIYMLEVVATIAVAMSIINNGDESILKRFSLGKLIFASTVIYTIILLATYAMFTTLIPITQLVTV